MTLSNLSIQTKLVLSAGTLIAVSLGLIISGGTSLMYQTASAEAEERARALISSYTETTSSELGRVIGKTQGLAAAIEGTIARGGVDRAQVADMARAAFANSPELTGLSLAFEPDALDGLDSQHIGQAHSDASGRFVPYFTNGANGINVEALDMSQESTTHNWYNFPLAEGRDLVTPPFTYRVNGQDVLMSTYTNVIRKNDQPVGVVTADMSLATIGEIFSEMRPFGTGRVMLVSHDYQWIAHWNPSQVGQPMPADFASGLLSDKLVMNGTSYVDPDGVELFVITNRVQFPGVEEQWSLLMEVPTATIYASINETRLFALIAAG